MQSSPGWILMKSSVVDTSLVARMPDGSAGAAFSWAAVGRELGVSPEGPINMAYLAVDRHARSAIADKTAFRFHLADGAIRNLSYRQLAGLTDRFAHLLISLGVRKGDCVFVLCGRICELYVAVLGALKVGAVVSPLFQAFGPEPIRLRIAQAAGKVLLVTQVAPSS